jgi:hypothetical protein
MNLLKLKSAVSRSLPPLDALNLHSFVPVTWNWSADCKWHITPRVCSSRICCGKPLLQKPIQKNPKKISFLLLALCLAINPNAFSQGTITDNFDDGNDTLPTPWTHYAPLATAPWNEQVTWTFPASSAGGLGYRIFGAAPGIPVDPATGQDTGPARVGSFRNDATYTSFMTAVDIVNFDDSIPGNLAAVAFRVNTPGFLTTSGYLAGYTSKADWRDQQGGFAFGEFQTELNVGFVNGGTNGDAALVSKLNPGKSYRMVVTGSGGNLRAAIYDSFDLLEPIVRIGGNNSDIPSGTSGITAISYDSDNDKPADFTFDNYYSSANPNDPIGFPGTPQIVQLTPSPQTLFYTIPAANPMTFAVQTFNSTQIATNALKMFLNGADVTSQLVLSNRAGLLDPPNANFGVRYTGTLASNTIYSGQIIALDTTGKGTTNNFVFDTFTTNGNLIVEAEDYNHDGGQYQDNPPVSGLDPSGNQVNGNGTGYYQQTGVRDVDYFDTDSSPSSSNGEQQYRSADGVGTIQNLFAGDTPRADHLATNVADYIVWRMQSGEWMNYTRTFPAGNWNVYLRVSSQAREDVRFDEITGDRSQPNQAKVLRGNFLVPNTGSSTRFRYVPLTDAAGNPQVLDFSGLKTFRMTALGGFDSERLHGGDDNGSLQPTYFLFMPTTAPAPQTPWIASASPSPNATDVSVQPTVQIIILNRATSVSAGAQLRFDGVNVTASTTVSNNTTEGPGVTLTYTPPGFLQPSSVHSVAVVFSDGTTTQSNQWNFTVQKLPVIPPTFALASGAGTNFNIQISKAPNDTGSSFDKKSFTGSSYAAERHVANMLYQPSASSTSLTPYANEASNTPPNLGLYLEPVAINYEACGGVAGFFVGDTSFPGVLSNTDSYQCTNGTGPNYFSMSASMKLQLGAGLYRMGVRSDDGFKVTAGTNALANDLILGVFESPRSSSETTFDFVVATNGVYNLRLLYSQVTGGADVEWYWVNRTTGARELVRSLALFSSSTVAGPYTLDNTAVFDPGSKTITVPKSGNTHFYRLSSSTGYTLGRPVLSGNNVVLSYQ